MKVYKSDSDKQRTDKVDYWKNSNQKQRWVATSLLSIEQINKRLAQGGQHK